MNCFLKDQVKCGWIDLLKYTAKLKRLFNFSQNKKTEFFSFENLAMKFMSEISTQ